MNKFDVPKPFRFNPWKHHLQWVQHCLRDVMNNPMDVDLRDDVIANVRSINSNHVDIYTGCLTPERLIQVIDDEIKKLQITNQGEFSTWVGQNEFQVVTLSDNSVWVLREGIEDERYIHVHPARNTPNAMRIHGNSWKTAIVLKIFYPNLTDIDLSVVNEMREKYLNLSPIKDLERSQRLLKVIRLLTTN